MSLLDKPTSALNYPFGNDDSTYGPLLKLALAVLLSGFIIPFFTVTGYGFRVLEAAINGRQMPRFEDPLALTKEGLLAIAMLLPVTFLSSSVNLIPVDSAATGAVWLLGTVAFAYITPAVTGLHAMSRTLTGTYNLGTLRQILTSKRYLIGVTGLFVFQGLLAVVLLVLSIPIVTIPFTVAFYAVSTNAYLGAVLSDEFATTETPA